MTGSLANGTPLTSASLWRFIGILLLAINWLSIANSKLGVLLLLVLSIMAIARWLYELPGWTVLIDQLACLLVMPYWPVAGYALALPLFEATLVGKPWLFVPGLIGIVGGIGLSILMVFLFLQAIFTAWIIRQWSLEAGAFRTEADSQRRNRYELERLKTELVTANIQSVRLAELAERNRLAQELHDDVGHELTGAVLALQAFEHLWQEQDPQAVDMFKQLSERLTNSAVRLRDTVHNIKPIEPVGVGRLQRICQEFTASPVDFRVYGDSGMVPVYLWNVLEPCLKESLTNVFRHATPTRVDVSLDISQHIVRLCIYNDGVVSTSSSRGIGLQSLRQRAQSVGGSLSVDNRGGFRVVCVLPISPEGHYNLRRF